MPKVIKPDRVVRSDQVVKIPDLSPPPITEENPALEEELEETETVVEIEEPKTVEEKVAEQNQKGAEEVSRRILQIARLEREKLLEKAEAEAEAIRKQAWQEGFEQGMRDYADQVEACVTGVDELLDQMQQMQNQYFEHYEQELKYLALDIAEKILHQNISENGAALTELIKQAVSSVKNADWVSVEISDKLVVLIHQLKKELSTSDSGKRVEVAPGNVPMDSVIIRTSDGVIDASIPSQLENLREIFGKMDL